MRNVTEVDDDTLKSGQRAFFARKMRLSRYPLAYDAADKVEGERRWWGREVAGGGGCGAI